MKLDNALKKILIVVLMLEAMISRAQSGETQLASKIPLSQLLINSTVKLESVGDSLLRGGGVQSFSTTGTSFFYQFKVDTFVIPVLVTNAHIIRNTAITQMFFTEKGTDAPLSGKLITINNNNLQNKWILHPKHDLAILPLNPIALFVKQQLNKEIFLIPFEEGIIPTDSVLKSFSAIEEVLMLGYPKGYWDSKNNYPIVRKGTTATPLFSDFDNKNEFLLDIPIYSGSSGSPVVLFNQGSYSSGNGLVAGTRVYLLGIATQSIDIRRKQSNFGVDNPLNIAVVIKASALVDFKPILKDLILQQQNHSKPKGK